MKNESNYRTKLGIFHPNGRGTGCALELELHPAHAGKTGCIMATFARQMRIRGKDETTPSGPLFDWSNKMCVKLDFTDLCKIIQVFRGECEALENGKGLFHRTPNHMTKIVLRHMIEPISGYSFEIYRDTREKTDDGQCAHIILTAWEALGLELAIENSIGLICFGLPQVGSAQEQEACDAAAV